jgi:hypothetical protein
MFWLPIGSCSLSARVPVGVPLHGVSRGAGTLVEAITFDLALLLVVEAAP